jgi:hypothetical protein
MSSNKSKKTTKKTQSKKSSVKNTKSRGVKAQPAVGSSIIIEGGTVTVAADEKQTVAADENQSA